MIVVARSIAKLFPLLPFYGRRGLGRGGF